MELSGGINVKKDTHRGRTVWNVNGYLFKVRDVWGARNAFEIQYEPYGIALYFRMRGGY